jgi:hypothetical protein
MNETPADLVILLEQITKLVRKPDMTWKEKRDELLAFAEPDDLEALHEFASWFNE